LVEDALRGGARRVVGVVQEEEAGARRDVLVEVAWVGDEPGRLANRKANRLRAREDRSRDVHGIPGVGEECLISRIEHREGKMPDPFLRADEDRDLPGG